MKRTACAKIGIVAVVFALVASLLTACSSQDNSDNYKLVKEGTLTVASSLDFPPFETAADGVPSGYSVALAQEIANRLGLACEVQNVEFDSVISEVAAGIKCDVAISSLAITSERESQVDFTDPYYIGEQAVVVLSGTYATAGELQDCPIAVKEGTTGATYARDHISEKVTTYKTVAECFDALQAGTVRGVVVDYPVAKTMIAQGYTNCEILERVATSEKYAIAVNKDNRILTDAINEVLQAMDEDGTLENLQKQYLGL